MTLPASRSLPALVLLLGLAAMPASAGIFDQIAPAFDPVPALPGDVQLRDMAPTRNTDLVLGGQRNNTSEPYTEPVLVIARADGNDWGSEGVFTDGYWIPPVEPAGDAWINRVLTLPDGSILYCGGSNENSGPDSWSQRAVVGRLGPDHEPDPVFGGPGSDGIVRLAHDEKRLECTAIEQLEDGRIAIGGGWRDRWAGGVYPGPQGWFIAILKTNGELETRWGGYHFGFGEQGNWNQRELDYTVTDLILSDSTYLRFNTVWRERTASGFLSSQRVEYFNYRPDLDVLGGLPPILTANGRGDIRSASYLVAGAAIRQLSYRSTSLPNPPPALPSYLETPVLVNYDEAYPGTPSPFAPLESRWSELPGGLAVEPQFGRSIIATSQEGNFSTRSRLFMHYRTRKHQPIGAGVAGGADGVEITTSLPLPPGATNESLRPRRVVFSRLQPIHVLAERRGAHGPYGNDEFGDMRPVVITLRGGVEGAATADDWEAVLKPDPNSIVFPDKSARPNELVESNPQTITGLNRRVPINVEGGEMQIDGGVWTTRPRWVENGNVVRLRTRGRSPLGLDTHVTLRVGGMRSNSSWIATGALSSTFTVTTDLDPLPGVRCIDGPPNTGCGQAIPDGGVLTSTINIFYGAGQCNYIAGVKVSADITHPNIGDLRIRLQDPNGSSWIGGSEGEVQLLDRAPNGNGGAAGSCTADDILARFADGAPTPAQGACGAVPGAPGLAGDVRPVEALGSLIGRPGTGGNGGQANGIWTLFVTDAKTGNVGTLNDWSVEVSCSDSPLHRADLEVTVDGPAEVTAGEDMLFQFTVYNNGPDASGPSRFSSLLPQSTVMGIQEPVWSCMASSGSSCLPVAGADCNGTVCQGSRIDMDLNLASGGSATITVVGEAGSRFRDGGLLYVDGEVSIPWYLGGSVDPDPDNNAATLVSMVRSKIDFDITSLTANLDASNLVLVTARVQQHGPSHAHGGMFGINLPAGYTIESWHCAHGALGCVGSEGTATVTDGHKLELTDVNGAPGGEWTLNILASWAGAQPPEGQAMMLVSMDTEPGTSTDTDTSNNMRFVDLPGGPIEEEIFANGFE